MAKVTYDYTANEIQSDIDSGRDFELEHDENRIVIEVPKGRLNQVLTKADGVLMEENHSCTLGDYINIIAETQTHVLAYLSVNGSMSGTGIRGMKGSQISALKGLVPSALRDISDEDIQSKYFPQEVI